MEFVPLLVDFSGRHDYPVVTYSINKDLLRLFQGAARIDRRL